MRRTWWLERLEDKLNPTATLYVDFGDLFPIDGSGRNVLTDTVGNLKTAVNGANPSVHGPQLDDASGGAYADGTLFDFVSFGSSGVVPLGNQAAFRANVMAHVRRVYEPLNTTVVELTATPQLVNGHNVQGASSLADISATLGVNEGDAGGDNDAYVLFVLPEIGPGDDNPNNFATNGYGGKAPLTDIGVGNNTDDTVLAFLYNNPSVAFMGAQVAHEAGHAYGLRHSFGNDPASSPGINNALVESDVMSYLGYANFGGFNVINRFPTVQGDGNTDNDTLSASPTPFDQLANDPQLGAASNIAFVSGTGAHDLITLAPGALPNQVNVTVQAFADASYSSPISVPGTAGASTTYTYTLTLAGGTTILVDAGARDDRLVIAGDLNANVRLRGMHGTDEVIVDGLGAATASYTPGSSTANGIDGNADRRGTITFGGTTLTFAELDNGSRVLLQNIDTVTFTSPGGVDDVSLLTTAGRVTLEGTVNGGTAFVPLQLDAVGTLNVDAGADNDTFRLLTGFTPPGGFTLNLEGGTGTDAVLFQSTAASTLTRLLGLGTLDGFNANTGTFTGTMRNINRMAATGGLTLDIFFGLGQNSRWTIQAGDDEYQHLASGRIMAFDGFDNLAAGGMADEFRFLPGGTVLGNIDGFLGNDTVDFTAVATQSLTISALGADNGYNLAGSTQNAQLWNFDRVLAAPGSSLRGRDVDALWNIQLGDDRYLEPVSTRTLDFSGFDNLTGGSGRDYFDFLIGGFLTGSLDGRGGLDTFSYAALASQQVNLTGTGAIDGFNANVGIVPGGVRNIDTVIGSLAGTTDRLTGLNAVATWIIAGAGSTYTASSRTLSFTQLDEFFGGSNKDTITLDFSGVLPVPASGTIINGQAGTDVLTVLGSAGNDTMALTATTLTVNGVPVQYSALERIDLRAGAGNDTFSSGATSLFAVLKHVRFFGEAGNDMVTVSPTALAVLTLDGGAGTDTLNVQRKGAIFSTLPPKKTATAGTYQFKNRKNIAFTSFEKKSYDGELQQVP